MTEIISMLDQVRRAEKNISSGNKIVETAGIILFGFVLGVLQKWLDGIPANELPLIIQQLDIGNYFGRFAIWILFCTTLSVFSKSPLRAGINTFFFLISMLAGYYLYCNYVSGFLPLSYMMIWIVISFAAFFMAYICWYAKGEGMIAIIISSVITGVLLTQAVCLRIDQGFYVYDVMEVFTWIAGLILLRREKKEFALMLALSVVIAVVCQYVLPF